METQKNSQENTFQTFLSAFGEPDVVREEMRAYWQSPEASPYPIDVYNHLINNRIKEGAVGIGCAVSNLLNEAGEKKSETALSADAEARIDTSKQQFQQMLGANRESELDTGDKKKIAVRYVLSASKLDKALASAEYAKYLPQIPHTQGILSGDTVFSGDTPEEAMKNRLIRHLSTREVNLPIRVYPSSPTIFPRKVLENLPY